MKRILSLLVAFIMAATIITIPTGASYAEDTTNTQTDITTEEGTGNSTEEPTDPPVEMITLTDDMVSLSEAAFTYEAAAITPEVTVMNGEVALIEGTDYTVEYADNINVGTATITVTGTGNYTGTIFKEFSIEPAKLSSATISLSLKDYYYNKNYRKPAVKVMLGDIVIDSSNYSVAYSNNKYPGTATVTITGKNNFDNTSVKKNFYISRINDYTAKEQNRRSIKLKWSYEKGVTGYIVYQQKNGKWKQIKKLKGDTKTIYTVEDLTPGTVYKFRVRAYVKTNSKTYYGGYGSTFWTCTRPSKVTIKSTTTAADCSVKVKWNKKNSKGYQVAISRYSDFRNKTVYMVEGSNTLSYRISDLKDGKKYYVKVRAYRQAGGKTRYGEWSDKKSFTATDTGWLTKNGYKYYYVNGKYLTGYQKIKGEQYYFGTTGKWRGYSYNMWTKIKDKSSDTKYLIAVTRDRKRIVVYTGSKGNWKPKYYWKCTVGAKNTPTPTGSFKVPKKNTYQYAFGREYGYMAWYSTKITGPYLFHSVLYQPGSKTEFYDGRLGYALSHGCIRVSLEHAKWIQDNIKPGTRVVIY